MCTDEVSTPKWYNVPSGTRNARSVTIIESSTNPIGTYSRRSELTHGTITAVLGLFVSRNSAGVAACLRVAAQRLAKRVSRHFATRDMTSGRARILSGGTCHRHHRGRLLINSFEPTRRFKNGAAPGSFARKFARSSSSIIRAPPSSGMLPWIIRGTLQSGRGRGETAMSGASRR
ncbi:MAG TPA: hypothetical protein DD637_05725 [Verrucomicrobia bacterium]|nr:hypothetical protein [Verrucomicrobiota bacterium]